MQRSPPLNDPDLQEDKPWLSRFDFYAPFVKELHLQPAFLRDELSWHSLANAVQRHPLLPHLSKLVLDAPDSCYWETSFGSPEDLACIGAFLCPSLVDIRLPKDFFLWLDPDIASQLLEDTALELRVLHIYVRGDMGSIEADFRTITRFQNLRVLKCTNRMIDCEKLRLLGTLPRLESLQIVSPEDGYPPDGEDNVRPGDWVLPVHSFPMLRHLSTDKLPASRIIRLWRLTSLVQPLVSVSVNFQYGPSSTIIRNICEGSPQAQELSLYLGKLRDQEEALAVIEHVRKLPLQRLIIRGLGVNELTPLIPPMANLEYLGIGDTDLSIQGLVSIAKLMPKLRFLSSTYLGLGWPWGWWDVEPHLVTPSPSTLCLVAAFRISERSERWSGIKENKTVEDYLETIAQYDRGPESVAGTRTTIIREL
ncbi:hypothetical protein FRC10_011205 [Ceratobasidium sp. 414]|nr:hypothetical protein FRC10_011205 [Ceratobasidium sp. 414]